ncbi:MULTISPECIES: hypothetical protein [unclassified Nocardiopsis]|uniref:hypothetical protein n=1 Tax=unclassified Nocardiopsis TaxID=2649073 RepID=UPI001356ACCD|nr:MULTISPECIES: hypothetical protein [unclassified Nocardiopsis]
MSNPTLATKLVTLVKGIFGRKDQAAPAAENTAEAKADATTAPAVEETRDEAATTGTPAGESAEPVKAGEEPAEANKPAEPAGAVSDKPAKAEGPAEEAKTEGPAEPAKAEDADGGLEPRTEPATPATADVTEAVEVIAEELEAAEAHTTVASDEVLERVRKGAAPSAEDLAVPTYDELTLPSVRARLRKLTIDQVRDLRAYEVAHQGRPEFIKMYDNRIAKLEAEV